MLSFFPRDVLDENLIGSVSEGFIPTLTESKSIDTLSEEATLPFCFRFSSQKESILKSWQTLPLL